mmetsp:Transcript_102512/g.267550  ORF Transcript_102512/g.267550 Transcript_102512/m.267550 type:complete len:216 (-) Transcript_102512:14-661(-)
MSSVCGHSCLPASAMCVAGRSGPKQPFGANPSAPARAGTSSRRSACCWRGICMSQGHDVTLSTRWPAASPKGGLLSNVLALRPPHTASAWPAPAHTRRADRQHPRHNNRQPRGLQRPVAACAAFALGAHGCRSPRRQRRGQAAACLRVSYATAGPYQALAVQAMPRVQCRGVFLLCFTGGEPRTASPRVVVFDCMAPVSLTHPHPRQATVSQPSD